MMPYINPNYFSQPQYQQMYQMPQMNQQPIQQPQNQIMQPSNFNAMGKVVEGLDVVKTIDIPMDGQTYYFPKADGKEIYAKQWLANGTTKVTSYLPQIEQNNEEVNNLPLNALERKFEAINEATDALQENLNKLSEQINKLNRTTRAKKVDADES